MKWRRARQIRVNRNWSVVERSGVEWKSMEQRRRSDRKKSHSGTEVSDVKGGAGGTGVWGLARMSAARHAAVLLHGTEVGRHPRPRLASSELLPANRVLTFCSFHVVWSNPCSFPFQNAIRVVHRSRCFISLVAMVWGRWPPTLRPSARYSGCHQSQHCPRPCCR